MSTKQWLNCFIFIICSSLILSSCGWHLRGSQKALPEELKTVRLTTPEREDRLHYALKNGLVSSGASIVEQADLPAYNLTVTSVSHSTRGVSTTSRGKTAEYAVTLRITFNVSNHSKQEILPPFTVSRERSYFFDQNSVASSFDEEKLLLKEMQRDLVQQIIRRYRSIKVK